MLKMMRKSVDLEPDTELPENVYLGCNQRQAAPELNTMIENNKLFRRLTTHASKESSCAGGDPGKEARSDPSKKTGDPESPHQADQKDVSAGGDAGDLCSIYPAADISRTRAWNYDMIGHAKQCVQRWCDLAKKETKDLPNVCTPCIDDHNLRPEDMVTKGTLAHVCSKIVMKCLYIARIGRPDILYAVNVFARNMTKWNRACDKILEILIAYIHKTQNYVQHCFVGDDARNCKVGLFCDASFAADLTDSKSTIGALMCIFGPSTFVPITWVCKKHGAVSHSSTEAEVIALDAALRLE